MKEVTGVELSFNGSANGGNWHNTVNKNNCYVDGNLSSKCVAERSGHVAFVEFVTGTHVYFTEANWTGRPDFKVQKVDRNIFVNGSKYLFRTFIHAK